MAISWRTAVGCASLFVLLISSGNAEASDAVDRYTEKLLRESWATSLAARAEAESIYREAIVEAGMDADLVAALTLVRIRQRRYPAAIEAAEIWVRLSPSSMNARRALAWLRTLSKDYEQGLVELERLAALVPRGPEAERAAHASFLGRVYGFLDNARVEGVSLDQIRESSNRVERSLAASTTPFLEARRDTVRKNILLIARKDARVAATEAAASAERDRKLAEIDTRRAALNARDGALREDQNRLQAELKKRTDELNARLKPLNDSLSKVDADGRAINLELSRIVSEIAYLESLLIYIRDPILRDQYYRDLLRLDRLAAQYEGDAIRLVRQADSITVDKYEATSQGAAERSRIDREIGRKEQERVEIEKQRRRADLEERRARRPDRAASRQNRVYGAQIGSLTTYAPFPLERERARLLEKVK